MAENQDEILRDRSKNPNPGESESAPENQIMSSRSSRLLKP